MHSDYYTLCWCRQVRYECTTTSYCAANNCSYKREEPILWFVEQQQPVVSISFHAQMLSLWAQRGKLNRGQSVRYEMMSIGRRWFVLDCLEFRMYNSLSRFSLSLGVWWRFLVLDAEVYSFPTTITATCAYVDNDFRKVVAASDRFTNNNYHYK